MRRRIGMMTLVAFLVPLFCLLLVQSPRCEDSDLTVAGFRVGGSVEAGWRLTDIDGSRDRYKEVVNLFDGPRLFDFNLWGRSLDGSGPVDFFSVMANSIGDPFPFAKLQIKKDKGYDFSASYREARWSFNREDDGILTDNHDFHTKRRMGMATLGIMPSDDMRLSLGYRHADRDGDALVPRVFFGAPTLFVAQRQELDERLDEVFGAADFKAGKWDFHVKQSFWTYKNTSEIDGPFQVEGRDERVSTLVSTVKAHTKVGERWDFDAGYIYAHSWGGASLFTRPQVLVNSGDSHLNFDTHVGESGLSYLLLSNVILHFDYRFHTLQQAGRSNADELPLLTNRDLDYSMWAHTGSFQVEYLPRTNLTLRGGYRVQYRNVDTDGQEEPALKAGEDSFDWDSWVHGWIGSVDWKPFKVLSLYGEYQGADFSSPYTWISPDSENIAKARIRYRTPIDNLSLYGTFLWRQRSNPDQEYRVDTQDYIFGATYLPKFAPGLTLDASVTYEKLRDKKDILLTPPTPFTRFTFDSDAIIYTGGISYEGIYKGLGARFTGSYAQTRGENDQRLADAILSLWYKNPYVTPVVTLERTYLVDHTGPNDGFDANMVTFSLRKEF